MTKAIGSVTRNPNPQGKGEVPVLCDWGQLQPRFAGPKSPVEFLRDYCVSSLVLAATFHFKPVIGKTYYLYAGEQEWTLSLIAPDEWGQSKRDQFLASCRLRSDLTWEMHTAELDADSHALARARRFINGFVETLYGQDSITANLPLYVSHLPYYQRMLATALAASLQRSLPPTGDDMQALLSELPEQATLLQLP